MWFFLIRFGLVPKVLTAIERRGGATNKWVEKFFSIYSEDLLRYTQITTKHVVIKAPAIPDMTHSDENSRGKFATSQGHTV